MNETKRLLKNTGFLAIGNFGAKIAAFVLLPLYTSILTTEEYGVYDLIVALNAFILPVVTVCIHEAMFRYIIEEGNTGSKYKELVSTAFIIVVANIGILGAVFYGCSFFIKFNYWIWLFIYNAAGVFYTYSVYLLRGMGRMKEYAAIEGCKNIVQIVLNVISIAVLRMGLYGLIISMCISEIGAVLVVFYKVRLWEQISLRICTKPTLKKMMDYGLPLVPNSICTQIINISDRLVISVFLGASFNGIYSVSYKFPNIIETVFHFFTNAWGESASRVLTESSKVVESFYNKLYKSVNNIMFSVILLLMSGMPILFRIFVRGEYLAGIKYVPILLAAMYFDCIGKFYSGIFAAYKQTKKMATTTAVAAIVNVFVDVILIREIGLYAAAISTLAAEIVLCVWRYFYLRKIVDIRLEKVVVLSEVIVLLVIYGLYDFNSWLKIGLSIIVASVYALYSNRDILKGVTSLLNKNNGDR